MRILEQNLLQKDETVVIATSVEYNEEFVKALLEAVSEMGGIGAQVTVIPKNINGQWVSGLTDWHWRLYASADLLITPEERHFGITRDIPSAATAYVAKVGNHDYRTDHELINRVGSKTRWLDIMMPVYLQKQYFPTQERAQVTLEGAKFLHDKREIRVTSKAGTDFVATKVGRPGHAQYGIADAPGRWDNFGFGCVACAPEEDSATGTVVIERGDIIPKLPAYPIVTEPVKLTFENGKVTKIEGDITARLFSDNTASYNDEEAYGLSHIGWGTHEKATFEEGHFEDIYAYHHNAIGTILFALGVNYGHGLGGPGVKYSGLGSTRRKAKPHIHFTLRHADFYCDGEKVVEDGRLLLK